MQLRMITTANYSKLFLNYRSIVKQLYVQIWQTGILSFIRFCELHILNGLSIGGFVKTKNHRSLI